MALGAAALLPGAGASSAAAAAAATASSHPPSRAAAEDAAVFRPGLLSEESRAALKAAYEGASPYPHSVIRDLCNPDLLRQVGGRG